MKIGLTTIVLALTFNANAQIIRASGLHDQVTVQNTVLGGKERGTVLLLGTPILTFNAEKGGLTPHQRATLVASRLQTILKSNARKPWWTTLQPKIVGGTPTLYLPNAKEEDPFFMGDPLTLEWLKCSGSNMQQTIGERIRLALSADARVDPGLLKALDPPAPKFSSTRTDQEMSKFAFQRLLGKVRVAVGNTKGLVLQEDLGKAAVTALNMGDSKAEINKKGAIGDYRLALEIDPEYHMAYVSVIRELELLADSTDKPDDKKKFRDQAEIYRKQWALVAELMPKYIAPADAIYKSAIASLGKVSDDELKKQLSLVKSGYRSALKELVAAGFDVPAYHFAIWRLDLLVAGSNLALRPAIPDSVTGYWRTTALALLERISETAKPGEK